MSTRQHPWPIRLLLVLRGKNFTPKWLLDCYFATLGRLTWVNYARWRYGGLPRRFAKIENGLCLHLGSGPTYLNGWINIEVLPGWRKDLWLDLRHGLPFRAGSIRAIYSNQLLEHLELGEITALLRECHRVMAPGGAVRFVVPDLKTSIEAYQRADCGLFKSQDATHKTAGAALNDFLLCSGHHRVLVDFAFLRELLEISGAWAELRQGRIGEGESWVLESPALEHAEAKWQEQAEVLLVLEAKRAS